jgi:protein-tyrosine-phosphatase
MTARVLFLCIHNSGRSQMALGFFDHLANGRAQALSAGSEPAERVNPVAVEAMAEVGIDISHYEPKRWNQEQLAATDVVITMGCGDECPYVPGTRYIDWPIADPAGEALPVVREIRDEIERRVRELLLELDSARA